jgi:hypothetical protein
MTTEAALQKKHKGILYKEEEDKGSQENIRVNKSHYLSE